MPFPPTAPNRLFGPEIIIPSSDLNKESMEPSLKLLNYGTPGGAVTTAEGGA
jgi:hypothetical protein